MGWTRWDDSTTHLTHTYTTRPHERLSALAPQLSPDMQHKSVSCYEQLFKIVIKYHEAIDDAGLVRCCKEGEIRRVACVEMRRVFSAIDLNAGVPPPPSESDDGDRASAE